MNSFLARQLKCTFVVGVVVAIRIKAHMHRTQKYGSEHQRKSDYICKNNDKKISALVYGLQRTNILR